LTKISASALYPQTSSAYVPLSVYERKFQTHIKQMANLYIPDNRKENADRINTLLFDNALTAEIT
jgi:hypothetical protein